MPGRKYPIITNHIYHVFNRGINRQPTFIQKKELHRAVETINFYRFVKPPMKLSKFLRLEDKKQKEIFQQLTQNGKLVEILSYCFMPNHFHLLLLQKKDSGIAKFLSNMQNSYTKYFNTRHQRDGSLFLDQFKAVRMETDEQTIHVSRYIHLNPYTSYAVKSLTELKAYPWSSLPEFLRYTSNFVKTDFVLSFFGKNIEKYKRFIFDQADYQRKLKEIEHLLIENT